MKKALFASTILLIVMITLAFFINDARKQNNNLFSLSKNFENIKLINKDFDIYLLDPLKYSNFDIVEKKIKLFQFHIQNILNNSLLNENVSPLLKQVKIDSDKKITQIQRLKSLKAVLNNSFRIIQKLKPKINHTKYDETYVKILTLDKNPEISYKDLLHELSLHKYTNNEEKYFLLHVRNILKYREKINNLYKEFYKYNLDKQLSNIENTYIKYTKTTIQKAHLAIIILFTLLLVLIATYLIYTFKLLITNNKLIRFKKAVENSDNIILVTDFDQNITYVNEAFSKTTGYLPKEVIGKKPNILKSNKQSKEFYTELNNTIYSGKKWSGEFINMDKEGKLSYEKASITPVFDNKNNIIEFIAIKLDISNERMREQLLRQQSKMAAMGEMIQNIAHQWRQPLSVISTISSGMVVQKEFGKTNQDDEIKKLNQIVDTVQYLSTTIDDFKDFFKPNKEKKRFYLNEIYIKTTKIIGSKFKSSNIQIIEQIDSFELISYDNEIIQVLLNILNNARDALELLDTPLKLVFVTIYKSKDNAIIEIKDNARGVPGNILEKIFEPYFTTKHKSQGTGIGLYMSYEMVTKHMKGSLEVENVEYSYKNSTQKGALFTITIPLS